MFVKILLFLGDILTWFKSLINELSLLFENFTNFEFYNIFIRPIIYYFRAEENRSLIIIIFIVIIFLIWFFTKNNKTK